MRNDKLSLIFIDAYKKSAIATHIGRSISHRILIFEQIKLISNPVFRQTVNPSLKYMPKKFNTRGKIIFYQHVY